MATTNLSNYNPNEVPSGKGKAFAIAVSDWNSEANTRPTRRCGGYAVEGKEADITIVHVPGSFERYMPAIKWLRA